MNNTVKRLLAMAVLVCMMMTYLVPTTYAASWWESIFGGGSTTETTTPEETTAPEETSDSVTYNFDLSSDYNKIKTYYTSGGSAKTSPFSYTLLGGEYLAYESTTTDANGVETTTSVSCNVTTPIPARFASGDLNWTFEAASAGICGSTTDTEYLPGFSNHRMLKHGIRSVLGEEQWLAFRIKSPGAGEYTVDLNFYGFEGSPTVAIYILELDVYTAAGLTDTAAVADLTYSADYTYAHDTVLARQEVIHAAMDPDNRVGKADLNAGTVDKDNTAYIGSYTFEADKEYIVVMESYEAAALSGNYTQFTSLTMTSGATEGTELKGESEVNSILVMNNVVPASDGGYMGAVLEVNGYDYFFLPLEGSKMVIYDLDKFVAGEEDYLVKTVTTGLYYPTHATVTDDGRVIVGGDGKKLYIFDTKTMTGRTTPDFRSTTGLENEGHNKGSYYGDDGYLYFGTVYGGHMVQYDMDARTYKDLGDMICYKIQKMAGISGITESTADDSGGVQAICGYGGYLYGYAASDKYTIIVKYDLTNETVVGAIDVSSQLSSVSGTYGLNVLGDKYLIAGGVGASGLVLIDLADFTLVEYSEVVSMCTSKSYAENIWSNGMGGHATEVVDGKQYFYVNTPYELYSYDVATGKITLACSSARPFKVGQNTTVTLDCDKDGVEELYLFTFAGGGQPRMFNPATGKMKTLNGLEVDLDAVGGSTINIGTVYEDVLYIGAWNNWNCVAYDTGAEAVKSRYVTGGQTDSQTYYVDDEGNFHLISGNYSACVVYEIDPLNKTGYNSNADSNIVQALISGMKSYEQKRIHTVTTGDGYVFAGTIPGSYITGGGVGVYNIASETWDFVRFKETSVNGEAVVSKENQNLWDLSVIGLAYSDERLFGATSRAGGSGSKAVDGTSAQIFAMDYETMTIEATLDLRDYLELVDADGDGVEDPIHYVGGITADPVVEDRLWGIVSDVLFCFTYDKTSKTFTVQEILHMGHSEYVSSSSSAWKNRRVAFDTATNSVFVSFYNYGTYQIKIADWNVAAGSLEVSSYEQILTSAPLTYAFGANNMLYYASGTDLYVKPVNVTSEDWAAAQAVDQLIEDLGDITVDSVDDVAAVIAAYDGLSLRDKALVQETRAMKEAEAQVLELQIEAAIANVSADSVAALGELIVQYEALAEDQQRYVQNYTALEAAYSEAIDLDYYAAANAVVEQINALPSSITLADEEAVVAAREAYDVLDGELQAKVTNLSKLVSAEAAIEELKQEAADVQTQIDALNVTSAEDAAAVGAARSAYDALSDEQKALVNNEDKLIAAEEALAAYTSAAQVQAMIDALPDSVTLENEEEVVAARTAYDALSDSAKAYVDASDLEAAEATIADLKAAQAVQAQIDALPDTVTLENETAVKAARTAYNALTESQQAQVTNLSKLVSAEAAIADLKAIQTAETLINALPETVAITDEIAITEARAAYDALTESQQAQVDEARLIAAEKQLAALKKSTASKYTYDFKLYDNTDFMNGTLGTGTATISTAFQGTSGAAADQNLYSAKVNNGNKDAHVYTWFSSAYPGTVNWAPEGAKGSVYNNFGKDYCVMASSLTGLRLDFENTKNSASTRQDFAGFRLRISESGTYKIDLSLFEGDLTEARKLAEGDVLEAYIFPAYEDYSPVTDNVTQMESYLTEDNYVGSLTYAAQTNATDTSAYTISEEYTFHTAGDYILVIRESENNTCRYVYLDALTLTEVISEEDIVASVGDASFVNLNDAFAYQVESGADAVLLTADAETGDLVLSGGATLDLNGHTLTVDTVTTLAGNAIIDNSENDTGVLVINDPEGNMLSEDNAQLPLYDSEAGGYRFFQVAVEKVAITGKGSEAPKYWFKVSVENFDQMYALLQADSEMIVKAKMAWGESGEAEAFADMAFTKAWAEKYKANNGIYITVSVTGIEDPESFTLIPCMTANGVTIKGEEMK